MTGVPTALPTAAPTAAPTGFLGVTNLIGNTTWTAEDSPIVISGYAYVPAFTELVIAAGTIVTLCLQSSLTIWGNLRVMGSPSAPVFISGPESAQLYIGGGVSTLLFCNIRGLGGVLPVKSAVFVNQAQLVMTNCSIERSFGHGLEYSRSAVVMVKNCSVRYNGAHGITTSSSSNDGFPNYISVSSSVVSDNNGTGMILAIGEEDVDLNGTAEPVVYSHIEDSVISRNSRDGVIIKQYSPYISLLRVVVERNGGWGIYSEPFVSSSGLVSIRNSRFAANAAGAFALEDGGIPRGPNVRVDFTDNTIQSHVMNTSATPLVRLSGRLFSMHGNAFADNEYGASLIHVTIYRTGPYNAVVAVSRNNFTNNTAVSAQASAVVLSLQSESAVVFKNNSFVLVRDQQNTLLTLVNSAVDATMNWWGTTDFGLVARLVSGTTTIFPFLDGPYGAALASTQTAAVLA